MAGQGRRDSLRVQDFPEEVQEWIEKLINPINQNATDATNAIDEAGDRALHQFNALIPPITWRILGNDTLGKCTFNTTLGWTNYLPAAGYAPIGYRIDEQGFVEWRGLAAGGNATPITSNIPAGFRPEFNEMRSTRAGSFGPIEAWQTLPHFTPTWSPYAGGAFGTVGAQTCKDALGIVRVQGLVVANSATPGVSNIATLPAGYIPSKNLALGVISNNVLARITVYAGTGIIQYEAGGGPNVWLSLDGIQFPAATGPNAGSDPTGQIVVTPAGALIQTANFNLGPWVSLDGIRYRAKDPAPPDSWNVPGQWPYYFKHGLTSQPRTVLAAYAEDKFNRDNVACPGAIDWEDVGDGRIKVKRINGLTPGRTYKLTLIVLPK